MTRKSRTKAIPSGLAVGFGVGDRLQPAGGERNDSAGAWNGGPPPATCPATRLTAGSGALIPLSDLGTIRMHEGPGRINRDQLQRYLPVSFNTHGRDIGSIVDEAQQRIAREVRLPDGYTIVWGGSFENMQRAM